MASEAWKKCQLILEPWDGVWTEELLLHLTVGITRRRGSVWVMQSKRKILVECDQDGFEALVKPMFFRWWRPIFRIDGIPMHCREALRTLRGAVPVNDDGSLWEVK